MPSFRFWVLAFLDFTWVEVITPVNKVRLSRNFDQLVHLVVKQSFKTFWKTLIFTETGRTQSLSFWSNFDPNLPPKIKEYIFSMKKKIAITLLKSFKMKALFPFIFNENYNDFLLYLGFFQVQIKKGYSRLLRATVGETNPVTFELFLSATPKGWKKISVISRCRVLCWIFWKKKCH